MPWDVSNVNHYFDEKNQRVYNQNSNNPVVTNKVSEDLSEYVLRIMRETGTTQREITEKAERRGYKIAQSYISMIISGAAQNISVEKLQALAAGLNRPEEEVFAVARGGRTEEKIKDAAASALLYKYQQLSDRDKTEIETLLRALDREIEDRLAKKK